MVWKRRATVSLCMIVRNEERHLADCLAPVKGLFDEIVIVDTGSHDRTREIAAQFTPHVHTFAWCDDFAAARNESLRRSQGEWIFWLDADDRLRPENVERLRALLDSLTDEPRVYLMDTACVSRYRCEGTRLITHPRLFRRHPDLAWQGRVHEQLRPCPSTLGYEHMWSDVQIEHLGYADPTTRHRKLNRDVRLLRMAYAIDPDDVSTLVHLGLSYYLLGQSQESRKYLGRVLIAQQGVGDYLRQVYAALAELDVRDGNHHEAVQILDRGLLLFPDDEYLLYRRADCLYELDCYAEARVTLERMIYGNPSRQFHGAVPGEIKRKLAPRKLGDVLRMEKKHAAAEQTLLQVVSDFPDDTLSWHALGRVYIDQHDRAKLHEVAGRIRSFAEGDVFSSLLLAAWHLCHNELGPADELIDRLINLAPRMPMPRLMRADWLARVGAPLDARIAACRDVLRVQPGSLEVLRELQRLEAAQRPAAAAARSDERRAVVVIGPRIAPVVSFS